MSTVNGILQLPNELLDNVLANVDHKHDLVQVRKSHRHFKSSARRLILADVCLPLQPRAEAEDIHVLEEFVKCALADTEILKLIRTLRLEYIWYTTPSNERSWEKKKWKRMLKALLWIKNECVKDLLVGLSRSQKLILDIVGHQGSPCALEEEFFPLLSDM
jgi:hypothetical protein